MNQDPSPGEAARVRGSVKEAIGKLTGDAKAQAEGQAEKAKGKPERGAAGAEGPLPNAVEDKT